MTIALRGIRRFGFWDLNGADLKPLKDYYEEHGSEFTLIDPDYMHQHYPGRRRMVNVDCSKTPHIIMWQESNPHEIAGSPSLSIFISPVKGFNTTKIKKVTSYQPVEYLGLTYHESDLLGYAIIWEATNGLVVKSYINTFIIGRGFTIVIRLKMNLR